MIQTVVLEAHTCYRIGVKKAFESSADISFAGEAFNSEDFFSLLDCIRTDVALLGVNLCDEIEFVDVARRIRRNYPSVKILAIANEDTAEMIQSMMEAGIDGYIGKRQASRNELVNAVRKVAANEPYIGRIDYNLLHNNNIIKNERFIKNQK
jgi:DNA-binding NarL/FixJ family response regulator